MDNDPTAGWSPFVKQYEKLADYYMYVKPHIEPIPESILAPIPTPMPIPTPRAKCLVRVPMSEAPSIRQNMIQISCYKGHDLNDRQVFYHDHQLYRWKQGMLYHWYPTKQGRYQLNVKKPGEEKWTSVDLNLSYIETYLEAYKHPLPSDQLEQIIVRMGDHTWQLEDFINEFNLRDINQASITILNQVRWREDLIMDLIRIRGW
jgi:hypothetical protein